MNIKLKVAYAGTRYFGWQIQKDKPTIAGTIQYAIKLLLGEDTKLIGASRTDKGVHAIGQIANFKINRLSIPIDKLPFALNSILPKDIRILKAEEADEKFHARYSSKLRFYSYFIVSSNFLPVFLSPYVWWLKKRIDPEKIKERAEKIKEYGKILRLDVFTTTNFLLEEGFLLRFDFVAPSFKRHMIRSIVGDLVSQQEKRDSSVILAPPSGLFLMKVE